MQFFFSVAAGIFLAFIQIYDPFGEPEPESSVPVISSSASSEEDSLPVYDNSFNLVLANSNQALPDTFAPQLTEFDGITVDERIVPALERMIQDAAADGVTLTVVSGYLSAEEQDAEFSRRVEELMASGYTRVRAEDSVQSSFGRGGYSENQTGLTVEFSSEEKISHPAKPPAGLQSILFYMVSCFAFPKEARMKQAGIRSDPISLCRNPEC